jgi:hypothetical protein
MENDDALRLVHSGQTLLQTIEWAWEHPLFKALLVLLVAFLVFYILYGYKLTALLKDRTAFYLNYWFRGGRQMQRERVRHVQWTASEAVALALQEEVDKGRLTQNEVDEIERKMVHILPFLARALAEGKTQEELKTELEDKHGFLHGLLKKLTPAPKEHPRKQLARLLG